MMIRFFICCLFSFYASILLAQPSKCIFKEALVKIDFGTGSVDNFNNTSLANYDRVRTYCPTDGHFSYAGYTSNCFNDDWHTLTEDHTPGDADGNMLLVNGAPNPGMFLATDVEGLKGGKIYEFSLWVMNLCRPTEKCGIVLLPNLTITLQVPGGKVLAQFNTGEVRRVPVPHWTQHRAVFYMPASVKSLLLTMVNNNPGGCGNDFAMDDIAFKECIIPPPPVVTKPKTTTTADAKKPSAVSKQPAAKKPQPTTVKEAPIRQAGAPKIDSSRASMATPKQARDLFPPPPAVLVNRTNPLAKQIEAPPGEIKIELYDNGQIDDDTVSIYHNNALIKSRARLSANAISFTISVNASEPYHEIIMVAENLGSIPPNTSVMIIKAGNERYEVFISSTEQKNAKVVIGLKK
jgi:hypothetical protein